PPPAAVASIARGSGLRGERADHRQCCDPRLHRTTSCWMPSEEAAPMVEEAAGVLLSRSLVESRYQNPAIGAGGHVAPPSHCPLTPQGCVECRHDSARTARTGRADRPRPSRRASPPLRAFHRTGGGRALAGSGLLGATGVLARFPARLPLPRPGGVERRRRPG